MNIEQRLAEAIQSFSLDALAGAVPLNVDLDVVLSVLAHTICAALRRRLPGYSTATPDTLQRRFLSTGGTITTQRDQITVTLNRRTYSPVLCQASLLETITVPWWQGAPSATSTPDPDSPGLWGPIRLVKTGVRCCPPYLYIWRSSSRSAISVVCVVDGIRTRRSRLTRYGRIPAS